MKCFTHSNTEAVAVCRSCGRAICRDCTAEVGLSCACKGRCETVVDAINDSIERGRTVYQKTSSIQFRQGIFAIALGIIMMAIVLIYLPGAAQSAAGIFVLSIGVVFVGFGVAQLFSARSFRKK